jgi:hypothetical protein
MFAQIIQATIEHALVIFPNMLGVLGAALVSAVVVSFTRGETTVFKTLYLVIIFVTGTLSPILGIIGGTSTMLMAHLKGEWGQRELAVLFTLLLFAIALWWLGVDVSDFRYIREHPFHALSGGWEQIFSP